MFLKNRVKDHKTLMNIGLVCFHSILEKHLFSCLWIQSVQ